jgi:hypothetical protein
MTFVEITLQVLTTAFGVITGLATSYYFFRLQQKADFAKLRDEVLGLRGDHTLQGARLSTLHQQIDGLVTSTSVAHREISLIASAVSVKDVAAVASSLEALRSSYDRLHSEMLGLSTRIIDGFRSEQNAFLREVQREFAQSVDRSKGDLELMFQKELAPIIPSAEEQKAVIKHLINLSGHAMLAMGRYHFQAVEDKSGEATANTDKKVRDSLVALLEQADTTRRRLNEIPMLADLTHE